MLPFILRRLLLAIPMMLGASLITFGIFTLTKVDPVKRMLGERAQDSRLVASMRHDLGLDDPARVRYWRFLSGIARGDFGKSMRTSESVTEEIKHRFPATIELAGCALVLSVGFGLAAGIASGLRRNTWIDYVCMGVALLAVSIPVFWLGLMLSHFFAEKLGWFPIDQRMSLQFDGEVPTRTGLLLVDSILAQKWEVLRDAASHLVLPAVALAAVTSALTARMTRSSVLEVVRQDFVRTARAKGLGPARLLWHILRNALIPVVTIIGLEIPALLGGSVITETIFSWPGMGSYLIESILFADVTAVQGIVMFMTMLFIGVNIGVDVLYALIDPRMRVA